MADKHEFWWNERKPGERMLWDSKIHLGEAFFNEIIQHPVPLHPSATSPARPSDAKQQSRPAPLTGTRPVIFAPDVPPENVQVVAVEELVFLASSQTRAASSLSAVHETQLRRCNTRRRWREHERPCDRVIVQVRPVMTGV